MCGAMPSWISPISTVTPYVRQVAPDGDGIVGQREAGVLQRPADLARIDVERAGDLDVARACSRRGHNASGRRAFAAPVGAHACRTQDPGAGRMHSCPPRRLRSESSTFPSSQLTAPFSTIAQMLLRRVHLGRPRKISGTDNALWFLSERGSKVNWPGRGCSQSPGTTSDRPPPQHVRSRDYRRLSMGARAAA